MKIRAAQLEDAEAIGSIFNHEVENGLALWTMRKKDLQQCRDYISQRLQNNCPFLIAELDGKIAGYANYGPFNVSDGFAHTAELSIYIDTDFHRRGIGRALLQALIEEAKQRDLHVLIAAIDAENHGSIALHQQFGFVDCGYFKQVGRKFGLWRDLVYMQLITS